MASEKQKMGIVVQVDGTGAGIWEGHVKDSQEYSLSADYTSEVLGRPSLCGLAVL